MSKNNLYDGATPILIPEDETTNGILEQITSHSYPEVHSREENLIKFARFDRPTNNLIRHVLQREHSLDEIRINGYAKVITNRERQARISHSEHEEDAMNAEEKVTNGVETRKNCLMRETSVDDDVFANEEEMACEKQCPQANVFTQEFNDFIINDVKNSLRDRHTNEL